MSECIAHSRRPANAILELSQSASQDMLADWRDFFVKLAHDLPSGTMLSYFDLALEGRFILP